MQTRKGIARLAGILAMLCLWAAAARAADPATPEPSPEEKARKEFRHECYVRSTTLAHGGDPAAAMQVVEDFGAKVGKTDPFYDELQGTVLAIQKEYPAAQASFERMLAKAPDSHIGRFNRAEMIMLQAQYEEAEKEFTAVEQQMSPRDPAVADLCRFKRVVCLLCGEKPLEAAALIPLVQEENESPALMYARATLEYAKHNTNKAVKILEAARTRFDVGVDNLYTDSLVELRWGQRDETGKFFFMPRLR